MIREMICTACPVGCHLEVVKKELIIVKGNQCPRGEKFAIKELTMASRIITSTVKINNAILNRLPVKTDGEVLREKVFFVMKEINKIEVSSPIKAGDIISKNIYNTGVNLIATRDM